MNKIEIIVLPHLVLVPSFGKVLWPEELITNITRLTMKPIQDLQSFLELLRNKESRNLLKNLFKMRHGEPTRHAAWTIVIAGASRSFLAQWTRHHTGVVYTSASQHYSDWSENMDWVVPIEVFEKCINDNNLYPLKQWDLDQVRAVNAYKAHIKLFGYHHSVARQLSTQAVRNILVFTANTQSLRDGFINMRACGRNTSETLYIADTIREILSAYHPDLFDDAGPDCFTRGICTQGKLSCRQPWTKEKIGYEDRWKILFELDKNELFKQVMGC